MGEGQGDSEDICGLFAPETQSSSTNHLGNGAQPRSQTDLSWKDHSSLY